MLPAPSAFDENVTSIFIGVISASHSKAKRCQSKAKAKPITLLLYHKAIGLAIPYLFTGTARLFYAHL